MTSNLSPFAILVRHYQNVARFNQSSYLSRISRIIFVEKKLSCGEISAFYTEFEQFYGVLSKFMPFLFQIYVEKKMTNMRSDLLLNVWSDFNILFPTDLLDLLGLIGQPLQSREMRIGWEHFLYHIWVSFIVNWPCINKTIKGRHGLAIFTTINMEHCTIL